MSKYIQFNSICYLINDAMPSDRGENYYQAFFDRDKILSSGNVDMRTGRGSTLIYNLHETDLVLRHYRRGGLYGRLIKDSFLLFEKHARRAEEEFRLLEHLQSLALPVPEPVIARISRNSLFITQDLVIKKIPDSYDLAYILHQRPLDPDEYALIGSMLRSFFAHGLHHTDLNLRNILINSKKKAFLIDFDKCFIENMHSELKVRMLNRLKRSFNKEKLLSERDGKGYFFDEKGFEILKSQALLK